MTFSGRFFVVIVVLLGIGLNCNGAGRGGVRSSNLSPVASNFTVPKPPVEFRGLWVATVENIDWPSAKGLSVEAQKAELVAILDRALVLHFNAVLLQVRPACDAFYNSRYEPWSEFLSGQMGQSPHFDPLAFAIEEAHRRGLELHAWFNPFRGRMPSSTNVASANHVSRKHPEFVRSYGRYLWLDPTDKRARDYSLRVIMDLVERYDVDGVHFDDYFFPYKEKGQDFPDSPNWRAYVARGGKLSRADWRRDCINQFIFSVYSTIKGKKPWVRFGISPFGIWQPKYPPQVQGFNAYEELYADSRKWLVNGWVDYLTPQLYWSIHSQGQSFSALLKWWVEQNRMGRHVWPGMSQTLEVADQVGLIRKFCPVPGSVFWHAKTLMQNSNNVDATFLSRVYATPAMVPPSPWLSNKVPLQPVVSGTSGKDRLKVSWRAGGRDRVCKWYIQQKFGSRWSAQLVSGEMTSKSYKEGDLIPDAVVVWGMDRFGNASAPGVFRKR